MQKNYRKKVFAGVLSTALIVSSFMPVFGAAGLGNIIYDESTYIAPDAMYKKQISVQSNNSRQVAFTVQLNTKNGKVDPYVYTGKVTDKYTLSSKISTLTNQGYNVIAGINGDFYTLSTGVPLGLTIHDGKIKTSGVNFSYVLAFKQDGTAFLADSNLEYSMTINGVTPAGIIGLVNKVQGTSTTVNFYNSEFGATTKTTKDSAEIVVSAPDGAEPFIGGTIEGTVKSVNLKTKSTKLNPGEFVLSTDASVPNAKYLAKIKVGDKIAVSVKDKYAGSWSQVKESIGAYQVIVKNKTVVTTDKTINPRTCVGIKADGSVLLYAVDGRQSGYSAGMNLVDVANYLIEQGCVTAVNMDGGGSTTFAAKYPWERTAAVLNKPSGGTQRQVSNSLLFVTKEKGSGYAENLHINQLKTNILAGAKTKFTASASDDMYQPVSISQDSVKFSIDNFESPGAPVGYVNKTIGTIDESGNFTAAREGISGYVTAEYNGLTTTADVNVLGIQSVKVALKDVNGSLDIKPGAQKNFDVSVTDKNNISVIAQDNVFTWVCDPDVGTIDQNGLFTATTQMGSKGKVSLYFSDKVQDIDNKEKADDEQIDGEQTDKDLTDKEKTDSENGSEQGDSEQVTTGQAISKEDYGKLVKEVQITVGTPPVVLANFEDGISGWSTGGMKLGKNAVAIKQEKFADNPDKVFFGKGSLKIWYDMKTKGYEKGAAGAYAIKPISIPGYPKKIGMWVYGDGKGHWLRSQIKDANGTTVLIDYTDDKTGANWTGWKYVEAPVPQNLKAPLTLDIPVRYMQTVESKKSRGTIWVDNIRAVYDYVNDDKTPPVMDAPNIPTDSVIAPDSEFTVLITDEQNGSGVNWDRVRLYLDGKEVTKGVVKNTDNDGVLRWNLVNSDPVSDGKHKIKIIAKDNFQNATQVEWEYTFKK